MGRHKIEIRSPGLPPRSVVVEGVVEVGREGEGVVIDDPRISRRHVRLIAEGDRLTLADLGSTNGTSVNGTRVDGSVPLHAGDVVRLGSAELVVLGPPPAAGGPAGAGGATTTGPPPSSAPVADGPPTTADGPPTVADAPPAVGEDLPGDSRRSASALRPPRPALDELVARPIDGAVLRFRPGTAGEKAAEPMATAVRRARKRLAGLGSEAWGVVPQICLVDPFPDPSHPGEVIAAGSIVDAERGEIWMVVTAESPPEPPERALALLFGAALPAGKDLAPLLEGYGLALSDAPDPTPQLRQVELPPYDAADSEMQAAMAHSFVAYLLGRGRPDELRNMLTTARPGGVDAAAQSVYGTTIAGLQEEWVGHLASAPAKARTGRFFRLTLRYVRPQLRRQIEVFGYMLVGLGFTVVYPFVLRDLVDNVLPRGDMGAVLRLLGLLGVALAVALLADLRRQYVSSYVSAAVIRDLRRDLFGRLQVLGSRWFGRQQEGDVLTRLFSDVGEVEQGLSVALRDGAFQVLSLVITAIVMLTLNVLLGVVVLIGAPFVAVIFRLMGKGSEERSLATQRQLSRVYSVASENYGAQAVVKAFSLEGRERGRFSQASDLLFSRVLRMSLYSGLFGLSVNAVVTLLRLLVLGLGAWLISRGSLSVGGLVAFLGIMGEVLAPMTVLTGLGQQIQASMGSLTRINEILEATPDVTTAAEAAPLPPLRSEIRLTGVGFSYTSERVTLQDVNCTIAAGSRVAFVGPTGAGKSSVLQLLMRFYDVDAGSVQYDGHDVRDVDLASLRGQLGVVFQDTFLFDTTIRENIALSNPNATTAEVEAASRAAELHEFVESLPRGYDTLVGERGGRLSGGQRQRLAIARALVRNPSVLLLDEATSALDPRTERMIADTLERVGRGRTTISVTHRLTSITTYDRIFVVVAGRLAEQGTHAELLARGGVYAELWAEQTGSMASADAFDPMAALRAVPFFAVLSDDDLEEVRRRLRPSVPAPGERFPEHPRRLVVVRRGRPRVLTPSLAGALVAVARLAPGDAFGVAAALGQGAGAVLEADAETELLILDEDGMAALIDTRPSVAAALTGDAGDAASTVRPAGGQRLSRLSTAPGSAMAAVR